MRIHTLCSPRYTLPELPKSWPDLNTPLDSDPHPGLPTCSSSCGHSALNPHRCLPPAVKVSAHRECGAAPYSRVGAKKHQFQYLRPPTPHLHRPAAANLMLRRGLSSHSEGVFIATSVEQIVVRNQVHVAAVALLVLPPACRAAIGFALCVPGRALAVCGGEAGCHAV